MNQPQLHGYQSNLVNYDSTGHHHANKEQLQISYKFGQLYGDHQAKCFKYLANLAKYVLIVDRSN